MKGITIKLGKASFSRMAHTHRAKSERMKTILLIKLFLLLTSYMSSDEKSSFFICSIFYQQIHIECKRDVCEKLHPYTKNSSIQQRDCSSWSKKVPVFKLFIIRFNLNYNQNENFQFNLHLIYAKLNHNPQLLPLWIIPI